MAPPCKKRRSLWQTLIIMLLITISMFLAVLLYYSYRNFKGYCSATQTRLTDAEKIDRAIARLFVDYPKDERDLNHALKKLHEPVSGASGQVNPLLYRSLKDFKKLNVDCCTVLSEPDDSDAAPVALYDRISGGISSFVRINYKLRYVDEFGSERQEQLKATYAISNCGIVFNY